MDRKELRDEICEYFTAVGVERSKLPTILQKLKDCASDHSVMLDEQEIAEFDRKTQAYIRGAGLVIGDKFHYRISWAFAPRHYRKCAEFVAAYLEILFAEYEEEDVATISQVDRDIENLYS